LFAPHSLFAASEAFAFNALITVGVTNAKSIACGEAHSCALIADGTVLLGLNADGELGSGTTDERTAAVTVSGLSAVVAIGIAAFTPVRCCRAVRAVLGVNASGELGDGMNARRSARRPSTG
jgi:hypothetical protein